MKEQARIMLGHEDPSEADDSSARSSASSRHDDASVSTTSHETHQTNLRSSGGSFSNGEQKSQDEINQLAAAETKRMRFWKILLLIGILLTGAGVCTGVYFFLEERQESEFENQFEVHAHTISDAATYYFESARLGLESLAEEVAAFARTDNASSFPFVTMPSFETNAHNARVQATLEAVTLHPIVHAAEKEAWEAYSVAHQGWIAEARDTDEFRHGEDAHVDAHAHEGQHNEDHHQADVDETITPFIHETNHWGYEVAAKGRSIYLPSWQQSPPPLHLTGVNHDLLSLPALAALYEAMLVAQVTVLGPVQDLDEIFCVSSREDEDQTHSDVTEDDAVFKSIKRPHIVALTPVFQYRESEEHDEIVAVLLSVIQWDSFLDGLVPEGTGEIFVVMTNSCNQTFTYIVHGQNADYLGEGLVGSHSSSLGHMHHVVDFVEGKNASMDTKDMGYCVYRLEIRPTEDFEDEYVDNMPIYATVIAGGVFLAIASAFFMYDRYVQRRNKKVIDAAAKSNAIVASLFPAHVREQLLEKNSVRKDPKTPTGIKSFLSDPQALIEKPGESSGSSRSRPIAELFPATTIMMGDIVGFTAWSSVREPAQVFMLLEGIFSAFDQVAHRRRVFKVETVGDCYVAVAGLPDPRQDHAVVMARFARDCISRMRSVVNHMEVELGPDTAELSLRVGLHSGQVTAGVLRGDRARFQLFGDTVNLAARVENTGRPGKIHVSAETADLLIAAQKESWLVKRADLIPWKGVGKVQTYWLTSSERRSDRDSSSITSSKQNANVNGATPAAMLGSGTETPTYNLESIKAQNLIRWNVEVLAKTLKHVIGSRCTESDVNPAEITAGEAPRLERDRTPLEEVAEVVTLPQQAQKKIDIDAIVLPQVVMEELTEFVTNVAALYRMNPFHNFEHASHVTMSVVKLMSRIIAPTENELTPEELANGLDMHLLLHDHTYGITSDPLTQFAGIFSALIHDVDHTGVPNTQLVKEGSRIAMYYQGKSVAEQNSVDLAWDLFMSPQFDNMRKAICADLDELKHFRQLVVNSVMATDIMDKEMIAMRNGRWQKAFSDSGHKEDKVVARNRKATIVIEHLIQASDVAHTMQHWHVYRKWNERLFMELSRAYQQGRAEKDPAEFWYKGEIGFFDFYIIPLAKKLKDCGVFGVSSDEYLSYAKQNRAEWETKGQEIVAEYKEKLNSQGGG